MKYEFDADIQRLEGKIQWKVIVFPHSAKECFGSNGKIPVKVSLDGHSFDHTLLPSRNGHYIVYNEIINRVVGKRLGDSVHIILEKDDVERAYSIPDYLADALKEYGVLEAFLRQPDYLKREQTNQIELAKKEETKMNRILKLAACLQEKISPK